MVLQGLTGTNGSAVIAQDGTDTVQPSFDGDIFKAPSLSSIALGVSVLIPGALWTPLPLIVSLLKFLQAYFCPLIMYKSYTAQTGNVHTGVCYCLFLVAEEIAINPSRKSFLNPNGRPFLKHPSSFNRKINLICMGAQQGDVCVPVRNSQDTWFPIEMLLWLFGKFSFTQCSNYPPLWNDFILWQLKKSSNMQNILWISA